MHKCYAYYDMVIIYETFFNKKKRGTNQQNFKEDVIFITKLYRIVVSQRLECFYIEQLV